MEDDLRCSSAPGLLYTARWRLLLLLLLIDSEPKLVAFVIVLCGRDLSAVGIGGSGGFSVFVVVVVIPAVAAVAAPAASDRAMDGGVRRCCGCECRLPVADSRVFSSMDMMASEYASWLDESDKESSEDDRCRCVLVPSMVLVVAVRLATVAVSPSEAGRTKPPPAWKCGVLWCAVQADLARKTDARTSMMRNCSFLPSCFVFLLTTDYTIAACGETRFRERHQQ
mmetsp:Transcript_631/g.1540  ORF Transcript_631/g.1540 Transcript_631/m.1540 type:complete len:225 (-) Transcript_631:26-700(-)